MIKIRLLTVSGVCEGKMGTWGKMSITISRLNSSLVECFFSQCPQSLS